MPPKNRTAESSDKPTDENNQPATAEAGLAVDPSAVPTEGSVTETQKRLRAKGYTLAETGVMDSATVEAVRVFQSSNGLPITGTVGRGDDPTWQALNA